MKPFFLLILVICSLTLRSYAQLSKMQFQDAEQAYSEGKFEEAIQFLNEAERSLGKANPPIMHMRILSRAEVIKKNPDKDFEIIDQLRKETNLFLKQYSEDTRLEDKYREVYTASKLLKNLPLTKQQFDEEVKNRKEAAVKAEQEKKRKMEQFSTYSYIPGFQKDALLKDFKKQHDLNRFQIGKSNDGYERVSMTSSVHDFVQLFYYGKTVGYEFKDRIDSDNGTHDEGKKLLAEKKAYFSNEFGFEPIETVKKYNDPTTTGADYLWAIGTKTFRIETLFYQDDDSRKYVSVIYYYDVDKK